jgi:hypothetical protein
MIKNKNFKFAHRALSHTLASIATIVGLIMSAHQANATTINVTAGDDTSVIGNCTFREAIISINRGPAGPAVDACPIANGINDKIYIGNALPVMRLMNTNLSPILKDVVIEGSGYLTSFINGNFGDFKLIIGDGANSRPNVKIRGLTIQNVSGSALLVKAGSQATLEYSRIWDSGNSVPGTEAIINSGTLTLSHAEIDNGSGFTGVVYNRGTLNMNYSTIRDSNGQRNGAISNYGTARIISSTLANNSSHSTGSAISTHIGGVTTIDGSTIAFNTSDIDGGGCGDSCAAIQTFDTGTVTITASIVAHNGGSGDERVWACDGSINSGGYNIFYGKQSSNAIPPENCPRAETDKYQNPQLITSNGSPRDNGGVGATYMPTAASPAIGAVPISNSYCTNIISNLDQRGIVRGKSTTSCDSGAVERASALLVKNNLGTLNERRQDDAFTDHLTKLGFSVTSIDDNTANIASLASDKHLILISESVAASAITNSFLNVSNTVIVNEPELYPQMLMTGQTAGTDYGDAANQTGITLQSPTIGNLSGTSGNEPRTFSNLSVVGWGVPNGNAIKHAVVQGSSTKAAIFQFPTGQLMNANFAAPGPRLGYFLQPGTFIADNGRLIRHFFLVAASAK